MAVRGDGRVNERAAGEPRPAQAGQRVAARDEGAESGGIAEEFVERERGKVGGTVAQAQRVAGSECRDVHQHVEPSRLRLGDERQRMPHAREVRLRRKGEQSRPRAEVREGIVEAQLAVERQDSER